MACGGPAAERTGQTLDAALAKAQPRQQAEPAGGRERLDWTSLGTKPDAWTLALFLGPVKARLDFFHGEMDGDGVLETQGQPSNVTARVVSRSVFQGTLGEHGSHRQHGA